MGHDGSINELRDVKYINILCVYIYIYINVCDIYVCVPMYVCIYIYITSVNIFYGHSWVLNGPLEQYMFFEPSVHLQDWIHPRQTLPLVLSRIRANYQHLSLHKWEISHPSNIELPISSMWLGTSW